MLTKKLFVYAFWLSVIFITFFFAKTIHAEIKIGCSIPLSTPFRPLGISFKNGILLGAEEINGSGGIRGESLNIIFKDTKGNPDNALNNVRELINNEKVKIIYTFFSQNTLNAMPYTLKANVLHLTTEAHNCKITTGDNPNIIRFVELETIKYNWLLSYYAKSRSPKKIAIFSWDINIDYHTALTEYISKRIEELGLQFFKLSPIPVRTIDYTPILAKLLSVRADAVVILSPNMPGSQRLYNTIGAMGWRIPQIITVGDAASKPDNGNTSIFSSLKKYGDKFPNIYIATDFDIDANDKAKVFYNNYSKKFGLAPNPISARAYDSIFYVAEILKSDDKQLEKVVENSRKIKALEGVIGTIKFLDNGDINKTESYFQIWNGTKRKLIFFERGPRPKGHTAN